MLCVLTEFAEVSSMRPEVLQSVADLLESICRDFQADIAGAEDYQTPPKDETSGGRRGNDLVALVKERAES